MEMPDIVLIIESEGITFKRKGVNLWAICPFHSEKTPSFKVNPELQRFYCFGCHEHGDVISFIRKFKSIPFKDACRYLGISTGTPSPEALKARERARRKRELVASFRLWERARHSELCLLYRTLQKAKGRVKTIADLEKISRFYHLETSWNAKLDILESPDDSAKFELFMGWQNGK